MMQELNYIRCGDYYIPDIRLPEENRPIGRWGRMHRDYIKEHNPIRFNDLCLSGELWTYSYSLQSVKNLSIGMLSGVLASSTSTTMILPRFLSLFWMEKFRKILPRKCRTPLLFAVNLSNYLNMQNRLLKWPLSREKMLRWYG